jgi:pyruvate,water dikinase
MNDKIFVRWFKDLTIADVPDVGGKNASLGEMFGALSDKGIDVPNGFATTAVAYWDFIDANDLRDEIGRYLDMMHTGEKPLNWVGRSIRRLILGSEFPQELRDAVVTAYRQLSEIYETEDVDVAVRSSATAEDLPDASFAGQQETLL